MPVEPQSGSGLVMPMRACTLDIGYSAIGPEGGVL